MAETIEIKVWVSTEKIGSECSTTLEFYKEDWEEMTDSERDEACRDSMFEMIEWGYGPSGN